MKNKTKSKTQIEWFKTISTDYLLSMRYSSCCIFPRYENDKDCGFDEILYHIDKELLYDELSKRPHRIRKKDRRKNKLNTV